MEHQGSPTCIFLVTSNSSSFQWLDWILVLLCNQVVSESFVTPWIVMHQAPWDFLGKNLEWVALISTRRSFQARDRAHVSWIGRWVLYHLTLLYVSCRHYFSFIFIFWKQMTNALFLKIQCYHIIIVLYLIWIWNIPILILFFSSEIVVCSH